MQTRTISTFEEAYTGVLRKLSQRDYSSQEIIKYLNRRNCSEKIAQAVLKKLLEHNYIDDRRLCRYICERWQKEGLYGEKMLKIKLFQRGFSKEVIRDVLSDFDLDEEEKANKLFLNYLKKIKKFDNKTVEKIVRYLVAKGFSYQTINRIIAANKDTLKDILKNNYLDTCFKNLYN